MTVHVRPDKVFGRNGDDLTVSVPVSFHELALGTTLSVPTLEGKVGGEGAQGHFGRPHPEGTGAAVCPSVPAVTATCS